MKTKNDAEVIIGGKRYNLSGYESEEYLQKVASYINGKNAELKTMEGYRALDMDTKIVLMQINLADDFFKLKSQMAEVTGERDALNTELFNLKHDIIEIKKEFEALKAEHKSSVGELAKKQADTKDELVEEQKKSIRLDTENKALKSNIAEYQKKMKQLEDENNLLKKRVNK